VFGAWASSEAKQRWFACHDEWKTQHYALDFRVGGSESLKTQDTKGIVHAYDAVYHDIAANERIVYSYAMSLDGERVSVSLTTIEFAMNGAGTRLKFTEQDVFLVNYGDPEQREMGTVELLKNFERELAR
jgi:uncharacterized protein YndB with AHSA1/START domain